MAETSDRPQAAGQAPPDATLPGEQLTALPPPPTESYAALSLLALAGFGIAAVYSVIVVVGAAVALFAHFPWLMPYWTFLIPLAALVICSAAATRIRNAEGTLSGLAFSTWGSRLAIVVGLTYAAYYGVTFFVVRSQAVACADHFFNLIKHGELEQAFLTAQGVPTKGMDKSEMRSDVEARFNQSRGRPGSVGPFTRFRQDTLVRFLEVDGDQASVTPRGVAEWEHKERAYRVVLTYHVATPLVEFDAKVETVGAEPQPGEPKGRQWHVNFGNSFTIVPDTKKLTPQGEMFMVKTLMAQSFVAEWITKINQSQWTDAYLDTLDPTERERLRKNPKALQVDPRSALAKLIRIDDQLFWALRQQREAIKQRFLNTFELGASGHATFSMSLQQQAVPLVRESEGRIKAWFDIGIFYLDEISESMQYMAEGRLAVSADSKESGNAKSIWRVDAIEIDTGRSPPQSVPQTRQPAAALDREGLPR